MRSGYFSTFFLLASLVFFNSCGGNRQIKQALMTTYLGTYKNGQLQLEEEHAAPTRMNWDKNGLFLSSERLDSINGAPFDTFVYTYNTQGKVDSYIHSNGDRSEIWTKVKYVYDEFGLKIEEQYYNATEDLTGQWIFYYDSLGNLEKEVLYEGKRTTREKEIVNTYEDSVLVQKEIMNYSNGVLMNHEIEKYADQLLTIKANVSLGSIWTYTYNDDGTLKTSTSNFGDGDNRYSHYYQYDKHGKLTLRIECNESGYGLIEKFSNEYYWFQRSKKNKSN